MGKSTAATALEQRHLAVIDTDQLAREATKPGTETLGRIIARFGDRFLENGSLRRQELASLVFSDDQARHDLEAILHPWIREQWRLEAQRHIRANEASAVVVVIPLLFETAAENEFDAVACVACSRASQQKRLRERGWSDEHIRLRNSAQWPIEQKIASSDYLIWSEGDPENVPRQLDLILQDFLSAPP